MAVNWTYGSPVNSRTVALINGNEIANLIISHDYIVTFTSVVVKGNFLKAALYGVIKRGHPSVR